MRLFNYLREPLIKPAAHSSVALFPSIMPKNPREYQSIACGF